MTWNKSIPYYDTVGREWWIVAIANVKGMTILSVARYMVGAPNIHAIAVEDEEVPTIANILLDDGFTTIYDEGEAIRMISDVSNSIRGNSVKKCTFIRGSAE